jgi:hypothetical protein
MKVLKTTITVKKINIDLVFCPAKKLYWEYLICKTCHCFKSNYNSYIECNFRKSEFSRSKSSNISNMEMVITELSNNFKRDSLRKKLKEVPIAIAQMK